MKKILLFAAILMSTPLAFSQSADKAKPAAKSSKAASSTTQSGPSLQETVAYIIEKFPRSGKSLYREEIRGGSNRLYNVVGLDTELMNISANGCKLSITFSEYPNGYWFSESPDNPRKFDSYNVNRNNGQKDIINVEVDVSQIRKFGNNFLDQYGLTHVDREKIPPNSQILWYAFFSTHDGAKTIKMTKNNVSEMRDYVLVPWGQVIRGNSIDGSIKEVTSGEYANLIKAFNHMRRLCNAPEPPEPKKALQFPG